MPQPTDDTRDDEAWAELSPIIDDALGKLPQGDRDVVLLRFYQGMTYREIGDRLGKNESAARKHTLRALDSLSSLLKRQGITLPGSWSRCGHRVRLRRRRPQGIRDIARCLADDSECSRDCHGDGWWRGFVGIMGRRRCNRGWCHSCRDPVAPQQKCGSRDLECADGDGASPPRPKGLPENADKGADELSLDLDEVFAERGSERVRLLTRWLASATPEEVRAAADRLQQDPIAKRSMLLGPYIPKNHNVDLAWDGHLFAVGNV